MAARMKKIPPACHCGNPVVVQQMAHDPAESERFRDLWNHDEEVEHAHRLRSFRKAAIRRPWNLAIVA
jgi:hypothetical protein